MSKLTKAWLEAQIEKEMESGTSPQAIRDLAALITVHKHVCHHGVAEETPSATGVPYERQKATLHQPLPGTMDKQTADAWVASMVDSDGVRGGRYTWHQAQQYAINMGIVGEQRKVEFYAIMNAMYADYHKAGRKFGVDKPEFYACLAKLWLEDPDAVDDKAGEYYAHVVKHE